jgi:hypothetical protein
MLENSWLIYPTSVCVSFIAVALKGFQHKNVIGGHEKSMFFTSYLMAAFDVAAVGIIVVGGWPIAFTSGTGAAFGMIFSTRLHDWAFKRGEPLSWNTTISFLLTFLKRKS